MTNITPTDYPNDEERRAIIDLIERTYTYITDHGLKMEVARTVRSLCPVCIENKGEMAPPHFGSPRCKSGSIASGGKNSHCTCDTCF